MYEGVNATFPCQVSERPVLSGAAAGLQRGRLGDPTDVGSAAATQRESHSRGDEQPWSQQTHHLRRDERLQTGRPVGARHR